jgi:hypothetical protein
MLRYVDTGHGQLPEGASAPGTADVKRAP